MYMKNYIHDLEYTKIKYKNYFTNELTNDYDIIDIIASVVLDKYINKM